MAIGLLGAGTVGAGTSGTIYTVPSGISHAVVHLTLSPPRGGGATGFQASGSMRVGGITVLTQSTTGGGDSASGVATFFNSNSVSMMLSPGDVVQVFAGPAQQAEGTVSGYEVP